jgi:hypothetical protein
MDSRARRFCVLTLAALASSIVCAEEIPNWTVPPYGGSRPTGELSTMIDTSPGVAFVAMQPCRVFDTRNANGPYGGPRLLANVTRNFDIDSGPCTGIPAGVDAYSMNFGAILADGIGFVTIWPTGVAQPTVSSINTIPGYVLANAAIVPAGTNGSISVFPNTGMHLYGDINGYFTDQYNPGVSFHAVSTTAAPAVLAENTSTASAAVAIRGVITSTSPSSGSAAVRGINNSTTGSGIGIWGSHSGGGIGVVGEAQLGGIGVQGTGLGTSPLSYGVWGQSASNHVGSAGVFGTAAGLTPASSLYSQAGVRGDSQAAVGVLGFTQSGLAGVGGAKVIDAFGNLGAQGFLGHSLNYGVLSDGDAYVDGNLTVTGLINGAMKPFIQPHPFDASKEIRYVSLEGPHSEVYFRGNAQIAQGITRISIPEDFRLIADPQTYSTLVTPVGGMATVAVLSEGRDGIVVEASRDVRIHYVVYAEREAMKSPEPIMENVDFRPKPGGDLLNHLPEPYRRLMIQNGTLNPDGTVNLETARRLGWDKEWEKRSPPTTQQPSD